MNFVSPVIYWWNTGNIIIIIIIIINEIYIAQVRKSQCN